MTPKAVPIKPFCRRCGGCPATTTRLRSDFNAQYPVCDKCAAEVDEIDRYSAILKKHGLDQELQHSDFDCEKFCVLHDEHHNRFRIFLDEFEELGGDRTHLMLCYMSPARAYMLRYALGPRTTLADDEAALEKIKQLIQEAATERLTDE